MPGFITLHNHSQEYNEETMTTYYCDGQNCHDKASCHLFTHRHLADDISQFAALWSRKEDNDSRCDTFVMDESEVQKC